jgi:uncharacterized Tic20 family protein
MTESNVPPSGSEGSSASPGAVPPPPPPMGSASPGPAAGSAAGPVGYATAGTPMGYPGAYIGPTPDANAKNMAMLAHLLAIFTAFIGPLVIWLVQRDQHPFIDDQAKEALNFQITVLIASMVAGVTMCLGIGFILLPIVWVASVILCIIASVEASKGNAYRYPFTLRLVS